MNRGRCVVWNKVPVKFDDGCETSTQSHFSTAIHTRGVIPSRWFLLAYTGFQYASESSARRQCLCGSVYTMQPLATWLTCVCRPTPCVVTSNCVPRRLGLCWSRTPGLLLVSAASPSMDREHGTVCQPILEHQIRLCAPSSVISRPTCFSSSLRCS